MHFNSKSLMVLILILTGFSTGIYAVNQNNTCSNLNSLCESSSEFFFDESLFLPESLLHDPVPLEMMSPQTDIFLFEPLVGSEDILQKYDYVDPNGEIAKRPLELALNYYDNLKHELKRPEYLGIINFKQHSSEPRLYIIDMNTGTVEKMLTAHGQGSDRKNTGYATVFSNTVDSHMSSLGAFITAETYNGKNGYSLRLDGIEKSNSRIRERAIVIHGADYVKPNRSLIGRSWGCPAVERKRSSQLIDKVKKGVLMYAWYNQ